MTIIMPCRNGERYLVETMESLQRQAYPDLEHIVLDACSTDGTLTLLARYPNVTLLSEPDEGANDALNKGITRAGGEILGFIAVDDLYPDGALMDVGRLFAARPEVDVVVGHSLVFEDEDSGRRQWLFARTHPNGDGLWLPELTFGVPGFFGCFFRRRVFDRVGNFDISYKFCGDRHFLMRIVLAHLKVARVDRPTIYYRMHSGSLTINRQKKNLLPISMEYFRMGQELERVARADRRAQRIFLAWHAFEGVKLLLRALPCGQIAEAGRLFMQLCWRNPLWPLRLVHGLMLRREVMSLDQFGGLLHKAPDGSDATN